MWRTPPIEADGDNAKVTFRIRRGHTNDQMMLMFKLSNKRNDRDNQMSYFLDTSARKKMGGKSSA